MINIFRKIRKQLANDNKPLKYMRYAFGEIILVVIGILIALQINSWNKDRIAKMEEIQILKNLHNEFQENEYLLNEVVDINVKCFNTGVSIMGLFGKERWEIANYNIDSLIFFSFEKRQFNPSENALQDLLQSGRYQLISNDDLKKSLYQWSQKMLSAKERYSGMDSKIEQDIVPYLSKNYSFKDIDRYGPLNWESKSILKIDKLLIFEDIEYENNVDDLLYRVNDYRNDLIDLQSIIKRILKGTE